MATDESDESSFDQGDDDESNDSSFDHRDGDLRSGFLDSETGSRSPSPFPLRKGDRVPHTAYRLEDELGSGGFGVVWRAQNDDSHELYTLKFCWPRHRDTLNVLRREGKLAFDIQRRLKDAAKRFVPIHDLFLEEDREYPFIAYQYLRGESLDKVLKRQGKRYSPFEAATIIYDLAAIISGIHELEPSVVHRDLKPANILVLNDHSWDFRVMDLGLARVVATATQAKQCGVTGAHQKERGGTCEYMSHEQYQHYETGDPSYEGDPSDDVHALGVIWYVLLAGRYFPWNCPPSHLGEPVVWSLLHKDLISWGLSKEQAEFLESCLQRKIARPANAGKMAERINDLFLSLRTLIQKDVEEIERRRLAGSNWAQYLRDNEKARADRWSTANANKIPEGLWVRGLCYRHGVGVEANLDEARWYFNLAADKNVPSAAYDLGLVLLERDGDEQERERGLCLLKRAAEQQRPEALFRIGKILRKRRALDVFPFVDSVELHEDYARAFALRGACVELPDGDQPYPVEASPKVRKDGLYSRAVAVKCQVTVMPDDPNDVLAPYDRLPIYLLLSLDGDRLVYGLERVDLSGHTPTILQEHLKETEDELLRQEYFFSTLRDKLKEIWLDPWTTCREKGVGYIEKAATLGHAEAQMWLAMYHEREAKKQGDARKRELLGVAGTWYQRAADEEHWGGRWEAQLALAQRLFAFFQKLARMEGRSEQNVEFLRLARTWCEKAQVNSSGEQEKWRKSKGEHLLDKIYRYCKDDGGAEQPAGLPG